MKYYYIIYFKKGALKETKLVSEAQQFVNDEMLFAHIGTLQKTDDIVLFDWKEIGEVEFINIKKICKTIEL